MAIKVFIDGEHGTTGLQIHKRLLQRKDIKLISIAYENRHNIAARQEALNSADLAILCLPDQGAINAVSLLDTASTTRIIDASTAHRTNENWVYGFGELTKNQHELIKEARFVSNPGCYATGAIALLRPLTEMSIIPSTQHININAVSGYTGGGKELIAEMTQNNAAAYFAYSLAGDHKHLPEIMLYSKLSNKPSFTPSVGNFAQGMLVFIPLDNCPDADYIRNIYQQYYENRKFISVASKEETSEISRLYPSDFADRDDLKIFVFQQKNTEQILLCAQLDNLGKGASGAAVQNLDLMFS